MAMELHLSTEKAQNQLAGVISRLTALESRAKNFDATAVGRIQSAFNSVKGVPTGATSSINELAKAVAKIGKTTNLTEIVTTLNSFNGVNSLAGAAGNVTQLANALRGMTVPRGMAAFVKNVNDLAEAAGKAAPRVMALSRALGSTQAPGGLRGVATQINGIGNAAQKAGGGVRFLGSEMRLLGGVGLGVGVWQSFAALKAVGAQSMDAADQFVGFRSKMMAAGQDAIGVGQSFDWLKGTANRLAIPIDVGMNAFSKLSVSMNEVGRSAEDTKTVFEGFSTGFRAMGLNAQETGRAFNAVSQMFTKGSVTMEELRQQLGEVFPAFGLLAKSMNVTTKELAAMMAVGQVSSDVLVKFAEDLKAQFASVAQFMSTTGVAAIIKFKSALFELFALSGESLYMGLKDGINSLTLAMSSPAVQTFAAAVGGTLGAALGLASNLAGILAETLGYTIQAFAALYIGVTNAASGILNAILPMEGLETLFAGIAYALRGIGPAVGGAVIAMTALMYASRAASAALVYLRAMAIYPTLVAMGKFLLPIALVTAAFVGLSAVVVSFFQWITQGGNYFDHLNTNLAQIGQTVANLGNSFTTLAGEATKFVTASSELSKATAENLANMAELGDAHALAELRKRADGAATEDLKNKYNDLADGAEKVSAGITGTGKSMAKAAEEFSSAETRALAAAQAFNKTGASLGGAGDAADDAANSISKTDSAADGASGALGGLAGQANGAAGAYDNLAASAARAASNISGVRLTGGGGGGGRTTSATEDADATYTTDFDFSSGNSAFDFGGSSFFNRRKGGVAGQTGGKMQSASFSSFSGAPQLRDGIDNTNKLTPSVSGGGIPTILHGNEAVVPLPSGGAIPVQFTGAGGGGGADNDYIRSINFNTGRMLERFDAWSAEALKAVKTTADILTKAARGGSGGGSSGGGGGGGGLSLGGDGSGGVSFRSGTIGANGGLSTSSISGGSGGGTGDGQTAYGLDYQTLTQYQGLVNAASNAAGALSAAGATANTFRYGTGNGALYVAPSDAAAISAAARQLSQARQAVKTFEVAHPEFMAQYAKVFGKRQQSMGDTGFGALNSRGVISGFADGSPNASKDVMKGGGFNAVLHPNEAVIPLPDGRSVPVSLPPEVTKNLKNAGNANNNGGRSGPAVVNFYISTPDAESFRRSETQITERMRAKLAQANERAGPPSRRFEDPTRRVTQVK